MMRSRGGAAALVLTVLVSFFFSAVSSADCIQAPAVVPGLSGGPVWLPPPSGPWRPELNDPRWAGGPVRFFVVRNGGTSVNDLYDGQYRVVYSGSSLYVSIQALSGPMTPDPIDVVYFGITEGGLSKKAHLFAIAPDTGDPPSAAPPPPPPGGLPVPSDATRPIPNSNATIHYYMTGDRTVASPSWCQAFPSVPTGCAVSLTAPPSWLSNVATWTNSPGVQWAVTLQINTAGLTSGSQNLLFGAEVGLPGSTVVLTSSSQSATGVVGTTINPSPATWLSFDPPGNACPAGISISPMSIGVWDGSQITDSIATQCPTTNPTCTQVTNTFRVEAQNVPAAVGTNDFAIRTRVRVADWGSQIADSNAPWNDFGIPPDVFTKPPPPSTAPVYFTKPPWGWKWNPPASGSIGTVDIDYTCTPTSGHLYCPWLSTPGAVRHQCILAEIALAPGVTGGTVQTAAAYRNMEFGPLSTHQEVATISLKGLKQATGVAADRDVYLYVQTKNLPPHGRSAIELPESKLEMARQYAAHLPAIPAPSRQRIRAAGAGPAAPIGILNLPLLTADQALTEAYPTYRVFAYYDSGQTRTVGGQARKLLVPMTPFGLYLDHKGKFFGFTHSLDFLGSPVKEIAPDFYMVRVASEGDIHVRTTITAEEQPPLPLVPDAGAGLAPDAGPVPPGPPEVHHWRCNCDMIGSTGWSPLAIGLGGLGASVFLRRARRRLRDRPSDRRP